MVSPRRAPLQVPLEDAGEAPFHRRGERGGHLAAAVPWVLLGEDAREDVRVQRTDSEHHPLPMRLILAITFS